MMKNSFYAKCVDNKCATLYEKGRVYRIINGKFDDAKINRLFSCSDTPLSELKSFEYLQRNSNAIWELVIYDENLI